MQETSVKNPVYQSLLSPSTKQNHASPMSIVRAVKLWINREITCPLSVLCWQVRNVWCIWSASYRSFRGHIRTQSAKEPNSLELGPSLEKPLSAPQNSLRSDTVARALYIEMLLATYPWADIVDLRMFLMGFDAGGQWFHDTRGIESDKQAYRSSWLRLAEEKFGRVPERVLELTRISKRGVS